MAATNIHLMICKWFKHIKNVFSSAFCCLPELEAVESGARAQIWDGTKLVGLLPPWCLLQVCLHQVQTGAFCVHWHLTFCRMGETMDSSCKMRDFDLKTWQSEGKPAPLKVKFSILWKREPFFFYIYFLVHQDNISWKSFSDPYYSLRMNDKVIALIDMDCFYVQVTEPSDRKRNN